MLKYEVILLITSYFNISEEMLRLQLRCRPYGSCILLLSCDCLASCNCPAIILIMFQIELNQKTNYVFRFWLDLKDIFQCFDCYELYDT